MSASKPVTMVEVWDPIVRYGHWALVAGFAIAYLSAGEEDEGVGGLHVWSGYAVGAIVVIRVVWGLIGSRYARFSEFACSPESAMKYLGDLLKGHARRYVGHSPAAAVMIFALLACLAGTVWTGLVVYADEGSGPLANANSELVTAAQADKHENRSAAGRRGEGRASALGKAHGLLANITLGLVILHVLGVGLSSLVHRENLVGGMISGRKRANDDN